MQPNPAAVAKHFALDFSAAGFVAAYFALQAAVPTMPDLPAWAVVVLLLATIIRGIVLAVFDDGKLTPDELAAALSEATADIDEARALIEAASEKKNAKPEP